MIKPDNTNPLYIDSLNHPASTHIRQLLTRDGRQSLREIIIDDEENILQAIKASINIKSIYYTGQNMISPELKNQLNPTIPLIEIAVRTNKKIFGNDKSSRLFAIADQPQIHTLEILKSHAHDVVVLEDLGIAGNIGNIIRTSLALGIGSLILLNTSAVDLYDRRLIRASRGYLFSLPLVAVSTTDFLTYCQHHHETLVIMDMHADKTVDDLPAIPDRLLLTFGSEKNGCSNLVKAAATMKVRIPMRSIVESLNVSASAGITLYSRARFNLTS